MHSLTPWRNRRTVRENVKADLSTNSERQPQVGKLLLQNLDHLFADFVFLRDQPRPQGMR
jgi:hypothetical protein